MKFSKVWPNGKLKSSNDMNIFDDNCFPSCSSLFNDTLIFVSGEQVKVLKSQ